MQPMQPVVPFVPWAWRDPEGLAGYADTRGTVDPDRGEPDSESADRQANESIADYKVEATDGHIGSIDEATYDVGSSYLVVDTGPWIFGRKALLPAGTVQRISHADKLVYVDRTKDQIKDSPEYDEDTFRTPEYRDQVGDYYTSTYEQTPVTRR